MGGRIVALAGGVGAARFLAGLVRVIAPERLVVIGNTGDDAEIHGLHIAPDLDTVTYTLAGLSDNARGWGLRGETFRCLEALGRLGGETWFQLGDCDLATHLYRTRREREGATLSEVTREIAAALGVRASILPMSDSPVRTRVETRSGALEFQTYFVRRRARDAVLGVSFAGARKARAAPGVLEAIRDASAIVICPSNPIISINPILAIPGIRNALRKTAAPVAAVSPIVGGRALKGPAARMMKSMGLRASAAQVAELYRDFVDIFVLDRADQAQASRIAALGMRAVVTNTIMSGSREKQALAKVIVKELGVVR
jgi:LPPG:FO 2-phospho-L-lactate transferase